MSIKPTLPEWEKARIQSHFGFSKVPFNKNLWPDELFDSKSQRELLHGLNLWLGGVRGLALVTGRTGVGKSVASRRLVHSLDDARFRVLVLTAVPSTSYGFLRAINRLLGLPMRAHATDLFDQAHHHLTGQKDENTAHPLLVIDDAEGLRVEILDLLRRLTAYALDSEDRFSVLLAATDDFLLTLRHPTLAPLRSRFSYAHALRPYALEDTRNYVTFHLRRAGVRPDLFSDDCATTTIPAHSDN